MHLEQLKDALNYQRNEAIRFSNECEIKLNTLTNRNDLRFYKRRQKIAKVRAELIEKLLFTYA